MMKTISLMMAMQISLFNQNPMMILVMSISIAMMMSFKLFMMSMNYWMTFLIIMIFISGIMILFMFIVSLAPNEKSPMKKIFNMMLIIILITITYYSISLNKNIQYNMMNSSYKSNYLLTMFMLMLITMTSILPPKMLLYFFKGMKTSK